MTSDLYIQYKLNCTKKYKFYSQKFYSTKFYRMSVGGTCNRFQHVSPAGPCRGPCRGVHVRTPLSLYPFNLLQSFPLFPQNFFSNINSIFTLYLYIIRNFFKYSIITKAKQFYLCKWRIIQGFLVLKQYGFCGKWGGNVGEGEEGVGMEEGIRLVLEGF